MHKIEKVGERLEELTKEEQANYAVNFLINRENYKLLSNENLTRIERWCREIKVERVENGK